MSQVSPPDVPSLIAGAVVRRLQAESDAQVFNLNKMGYASDLSSFEALPQPAESHILPKAGLTDGATTTEAVRQADADLVKHLAAESHVNRSIEGPAAFGSTSSPAFVYIDGNVTGTFHLLQAVLSHWEALPAERADGFRFKHISNDEVFGSLGATGRFSETNPLRGAQLQFGQQGRHRPPGECLAPHL
jgi:dTDP-glucose 4,6-dehydratase